MSLSMRTLRVKTSLAGSRCSPSTLRLSICINQFKLERTTPLLTTRNFSQTTHADLEENDAGDVRVQSRNSGTFNPASGLNALRSRNKLLKETSKTAGQKSHRTILGQSPDIPIRARFAPSPTGYLHLGSLRTALFNSLAAKASNGGAFILRVEDTDQVGILLIRDKFPAGLRDSHLFQSRLVHDAEERLIRDLKWAGLSWDEGPDCGGKYGPYKQVREYYHTEVRRQMRQNLTIKN